MRFNGNALTIDNMRDDFPDIVAWIHQVHNPAKINGSLEYEIRHVAVTLLDPIDSLPLGVNLKRLDLARAAFEAVNLVLNTIGDIEAVEQRLRENPTVRNTVVRLLEDRGLTLQFFIRNNAYLDLIVNFSTSDVLEDFPYDLFRFSQLLISLAELLHFQHGVLHFHIGSFTLHASDVRVFDEMQRTTVHIRPMDLPLGFAGWTERDWHSVTDRADFILEVSEREDLEGVNLNKLNDSERWYVDQLRHGQA